MCCWALTGAYKVGGTNMGIWMSKMLSYFGDREARILVLGLDNAGKTTILCECGNRPVGWI